MAQIDPKKLLDTAKSLLDHQAAQGRPRQAFVRRSISTAYYAFFHALCWGTVCHLLPDGTAEDRLSLARSIDHATLRKVCEWIANPSASPLHVRGVVTQLASKNGVLNIALAFPDLLQPLSVRPSSYLAQHLRGFYREDIVASLGFRPENRVTKKHQGSPASSWAALLSF